MAGGRGRRIEVKKNRRKEWGRQASEEHFEQ
jgi:hypothetical protein